MKETLVNAGELRSRMSQLLAGHVPLVQLLSRGQLRRLYRDRYLLRLTQWSRCWRTGPGEADGLVLYPVGYDAVRGAYSAVPVPIASGGRGCLGRCRLWW